MTADQERGTQLADPQRVPRRSPGIPQKARASVLTGSGHMERR